jgi:hypothetical protein
MRSEYIARKPIFYTTGEHPRVARFDTLAEAKEHAKYLLVDETTNEPLRYAYICDNEHDFVADLFREGYHGQVLNDGGEVIID